MDTGSYHGTFRVQEPKKFTFLAQDLSRSRKITLKRSHRAKIVLWEYNAAIIHANSHIFNDVGVVVTDVHVHFQIWW